MAADDVCVKSSKRERDLRQDRSSWRVILDRAFHPFPSGSQFLKPADLLGRLKLL